MRYLRQLRLPDPAQRIVLEEYILAVEAAVERKIRLEEHMKQVLESWEPRPYVDAFRALRGIDTVAAMTLVSEMGDLSRFGHPRQLMGWLGLVPSEDSTGSRRRQGAITKAGNSHARWMLVEVAHHCSRPPKISRALSLRQQGQSRKVIDLSWRSQLRLNHRFACLRARRLHRNKVVVAVARELAGFLWELHRIVKSQQQQTGGRAAGISN